VHVIACHKGVTENQAVGLLGFPDATIVTPAFGVYVADNVQKIQLILLANCRDESSTRYAVQRFFRLACQVRRSKVPCGTRHWQESDCRRNRGAGEEGESSWRQRCRSVNMSRLLLRVRTMLLRTGDGVEMAVAEVQVTQVLCDGPFPGLRSPIHLRGGETRG
jgi:hypothetical protein